MDKAGILLEGTGHPARDWPVPGSGLRVSGHFGELMQGRLGPRGPVALITLPCARLGLHARLAPRLPLGLYGSGHSVGDASDLRRLLHLMHLRPRGGGGSEPAGAPGRGPGGTNPPGGARPRVCGWAGAPRRHAPPGVGGAGAAGRLW
jgi:hypothetical protein